MTPLTLYRNGRVHSPADPAATALAVRDGRIAWLGPDADAPTGADAVYDLAGGLLAPAFVDAHVHSTDTGIVLLGLNLAGSWSPAEVLDRVARHAARLPADSVVLGHGWDESTWPVQTPPDAAELDRAASGRRVYLAQASVHSALVSSALLARCPADTPGYDASGWLRRDAHHVVRELAMGALSAGQRRIAQRGALSRAAALGIAAVHECGGPGTSSEVDFQAVLELGRSGELPEVYGYWGELGAAVKARELGAIGAGGDLYADGALGSRTAHLRQPYLDTGGCGAGYLSAEQVGTHLVECVNVGVQGGFHAIGDRAIATVLAGFALAAMKVGVDAVRDARHRIEHLEILDKQLIAGLVNFGVVASVQPAFDRLWGGDDAMYAHRLGVARSLASNPLGALAGVGVPMAFGSDAPVTPLDPWGTIRAALRHHNPVQRVGARVGFAAHTRGGWRAALRDDEGVLAPGAPATFAVWQPTELVGGLPRLVPADEDGPLPELPVCRRTVLRGAVIYDSDR
jgi:predicted amidohydrolase YtcJ